MRMDFLSLGHGNFIVGFSRLQNKGAKFLQHAKILSCDIDSNIQVLVSPTWFSGHHCDISRYQMKWMKINTTKLSLHSILYPQSFMKGSLIYTQTSRSTVNVSKKYSAIGNSAFRNYVVLYSKLVLKTVPLQVSYGKND